MYDIKQGQEGASSSAPKTTANARKCVRIASYNFKGGVGKTTMSVNLAAQLYKMKKRVAVLDADAQCNMTSHLRRYIDRSGEETEEHRSDARPQASENENDGPEVPVDLEGIFPKSIRVSIMVLHTEVCTFVSSQPCCNTRVQGIF